MYFYIAFVKCVRDPDLISGHNLADAVTESAAAYCRRLY